jgi:hypothetical protein
VRDLVRWLRTAPNPQRERRQPGGPVAGTVNPRTGKRYLSAECAPTTINHQLAVLGTFYDFHRHYGRGPVADPQPRDLPSRFPAPADDPRHFSRAAPIAGAEGALAPGAEGMGEERERPATDNSVTYSRANYPHQPQTTDLSRREPPPGGSVSSYAAPHLAACPHPAPCRPGRGSHRPSRAGAPGC